MDEQSKEVSRRQFLTGSAVGLGGLGALAVAPAWALKSSEPVPDLETPVVAFIRDAAKGEVVFMVGTKEVVRKDRALVSQLIRCCEV